MTSRAYLLVPFLVVALLALVSGCSMPLRKPEPYEKRDTVASLPDAVNERNREMYEAYRRTQEVSAWYRCIDLNRIDQC